MVSTFSSCVIVQHEHDAVHLAPETLETLRRSPVEGQMSFSEFERLFQNPVDQSLLRHPSRGARPIVHENRIRSSAEIVHISQVEFVAELGTSVLRVERINDPRLLMLEYASSTVDLLPVGVTLTDPLQPDNPLIYVNQTVCAMTGYSFDEMIGRNCRFLQGDNRQQQGAREIRAAIAAQKPVETTLVNYRKDGTMFYNELHLFPLKNEAGQTIRFLGIQHDVTDRQKALKDAEHTKRLTAAATSSLGYAFGSLHLLTGVIRPSHHFAKMIGVSGSEVSLSKLLAKFSLKDQEEISKGIQGIQDGTTSVWRRHVLLSNESGTAQPFLLAIAPIVESILGSAHEVCISLLPLDSESNSHLQAS